MKKLLLILVVVATVFSCTQDEDKNFSAIAQLVGDWELQSKTINNLPVSNENESLYFSEDNNISDFSGNYELITEGTSSGNFNIDTQFANIIFTSTIEITTTYRFFLNNISMVLTHTDANGDVISDTWVKVID